MSRHTCPLALLVAVSAVLACDRSADLSPPEVETVLDSQATLPVSALSIDRPPTNSGAADRVSKAALNGNWIGRWRAGLTAYTEIAGRSFESPIHGRDIQLDVKEDGRFLFFIQEYSYNATGDVSFCTIETRVGVEGAGLVMREEKSTCTGRHLLARNHTASVYLVSPCLLKIETSPSLSGMNDFALVRVGCAKVEKVYPSPGL